jgi:Leucine-rich repeat (LRR) protein
VTQTGDETSIRFMDTTTRKEHCRVPVELETGLDNRIFGGRLMSFSPDGSKLAFSFEGSECRLWDVRPALGLPRDVAKYPLRFTGATRAKRDAAREELTRRRIDPETRPEALRLEGKRLEALPFLEPFPAVTSIELDEGTCDEHLVQVARLSQLRSVTISGRGVTAKGIRCLQSIGRLEDLALTTGEASDARLAAIGALRELRSLRLTANGLTDEGLKRVSELTNLSELTFVWDKGAATQWKATPAGFAALSKLKQLKRLFFIDVPLDDADLLALRRLRSLNGLSLCNCPVTDAGLDALTTMHDLEWLVLRAPKVSGPGLRTLIELKKLAFLDLSETRVNDVGLASVREMKQLIDLTLPPAVSDKGLEAIVGLKNLRSLTLTGNKVSEEGLRRVAAMPKLGELDLSETNVSDATLKHLRIWNQDLNVVSPFDPAMRRSRRDQFPGIESLLITRNH